ARMFKGTTRVMLFTDERPNVGDTSADGFMTMAIEASHDGVGLTTIGVGEQFDTALATKIGSVRGGNLFFLRDAGDAKEIFDRDFDFMVSELAYDLDIEVTPRAGFVVTGVYGVPGELLGWQDAGTVRVTIPTVFLSSRNGAIFVALGQDLEHKDL